MKKLSNNNKPKGMKGIYLYCVREVSKSVPRARGINGAKVFTVPYKDIEAVVSTVDTKKMSTDEIEKRATEDVGWVIARAKEHEKVIELSMGVVQHGSRSTGIKAVIPMKFGVMFVRAENLEDVLRAEYKKFTKLLSRLAGQEEWSVKVYAKEASIQEGIKTSERSVQKHIERAKRLPRGADYFGELDVRDALGSATREKEDASRAMFFKLLSVPATKATQNKPLPRHDSLGTETIGRAEPMILNSAYLVAKGKVREFVRKVRELQKVHPEFVFEYTGPWPPYNFVA